MSPKHLLTSDVMSKTENVPNETLSFGRYFKQTRENKGISQTFVAKKAGITVTQLSRIENDQSGTKRETALQLTEAASFSEQETQEALRFAGYIAHGAETSLPKPILEAIGKNGNLTENDNILIANFIDMLGKQRAEEEKNK